MKKEEFKKQIGLDFSRENDEVEITGTIEDLKIFQTLPIKIKNAGKGYTFKNSNGNKYKIKIINTELKKSVMFALQAINSKYRVNNISFEFSIPVLDIINAFRKTWMNQATQEEYCSCERCGGTGNMPYSYANGICFRCEGSGIDPKLIKIIK